MAPFFERWNGINAKRLYFRKLLATSKLIGAIFLPCSGEFVMRPGRPLVLVG
jgi:hypothetical protein